MVKRRPMPRRAAVDPDTMRHYHIRRMKTARRHAQQFWAAIYFTAAVCALVSPPTLALILVGMCPSFVAFFADNRPGRAVSRAVGCLNLAGVLPFVMQLWASGGDFDALLVLLGDVYVWLVMYASAAAGWMLLWFVPAVALIWHEQRSNQTVRRMRSVQDELVKEWGTEVSSAQD